MKKNLSNCFKNLLANNWHDPYRTWETLFQRWNSSQKYKHTVCHAYMHRSIGLLSPPKIQRNKWLGFLWNRQVLSNPVFDWEGFLLRRGVLRTIIFIILIGRWRVNEFFNVCIMSCLKITTLVAEKIDQFLFVVKTGSFERVLVYLLVFTRGSKLVA